MTTPDTTDRYASTADLYDHVTDYRDRPDVAFFVEEAQAAGGPVLEVGCGTGRVLIPTARARVAITGVDYSDAMLDVCRQRLAQEPPEVQQRVQLAQGDMRDFDFGRQFALVTTPFRPFQHMLTVEDQLAALHNFHRHLVDGGRLILDIFNPSLPALTSDNIGQEVSLGEPVLLPDGRRMARSDKIVARDRFRQIIEAELLYEVIDSDGHHERRALSIQLRYLFRYEAEHLLARCGFAVEQLYADYDRSAYGSKYPGELIFVARKV